MNDSRNERSGRHVLVVMMTEMVDANRDNRTGR